MNRCVEGKDGGYVPGCKMKPSKNLEKFEVGEKVLKNRRNVESEVYLETTWIVDGRTEKYNQKAMRNMAVRY